MSQRQLAPLVCSFLLSGPALALAQEPRFTIGAITTREAMEIDGGKGSFMASGPSLRVRVGRYFSLDTDLTKAFGQVSDSYQGVFFSIAPAGATREEIERLGVVLRRDRTWTPGTGAALSLVVHTPPSQRVGLAASLGIAGRAMKLDDLKTLVSVPEGWDAARSTGAGGIVTSRTHGGWQVGLAAPINLSRRVTIIPEARWTGAIADEDYASSTLGLRAGWRF
jgi:hypothetical protein